MIRHPFTLDHLSRALSEKLSGAVLLEAYSQEKYIIVMRFDRSGEDITILASVQPMDSRIVVRTDLRRSRKNTLDVFPDLVGQRVATVTRHPENRIITFWFETVQLHVMMFGNATGNIIATSDGVVVDALRDKQPLVGSPLTLPEYTPKLGAYYEELARNGVDVERACAESTTYYVLERGTDILFSLLPLPGWTITEATSDIIAAMRRVLQTRRKRMYMNAAKKLTLKRLEREKSKLQRGIDGMQSDVAKADKASLYRMHADLLLSLPNPTSNAEPTLALTDWNGIDHTIVLDPKRTYLQNAEALYDRAHKSEKAAEERQRRLPQYIGNLSRVEEQIARIESAVSLEEVESLFDSPMEQKSKTTNAPTPYRTFALDDTFTLYVGRSAANNDELTMRFAKQNDWWFHARGVTGSHAVLRGGEGATKPPRQILERAAGIAAYYSHARNATYVPVVYTQKKYVRKPKGANVGAVTLEREEVIMVKPELPAGATE